MAAASEARDPKKFVVDCSVAVSWFLQDEKNAEIHHTLEALRTIAAYVPGIFFLEFMNVLLVGEQRNRLSQAESKQIIDRLSLLSIEVDFSANSAYAGDVLDLARQYSLTTYDAAYLELALRLSLPLATFDKSLRKAAKAAGVKVVNV